MTLVITIFLFIISSLCSCHAVLNKRDSRAATGWVGIIWLVPFLGSVLYLFFGINRIQRLAKNLRNKSPVIPIHDFKHGAMQTHFNNQSSHLQSLIQLGAKVTGRELLFGNTILPLINGDEAFPKMLNAINNAKNSITLSSYIFDSDRVGSNFITALTNAVNRNVEVRVLLDDIGIYYSTESVYKILKKNKIPVARFMGALRPKTFPHINLRKHRKLLIVDGVIGYTGGMNIREGHQLSLNPKHPVQDLHFEIQGPLITQLQEVFIEDWAFTTQEILNGFPWFSESISKQGQALARVITDGPDEDINKLRLIIEGAISVAQKNIWITTPYFLPDTSLTNSLYIAAGKGVSVNIIIPKKNNLPFVQWAANPLLLPLLQHGCNIWFSDPPFDHTKLMLVDNSWALFGSANWDPRSLRLNFECNVECYDSKLCEKLYNHLQQKILKAQKITEKELLAYPLWVRVRDGVARLFSPYL